MREDIKKAMNALDVLTSMEEEEVQSIEDAQNGTIWFDSQRDAYQSGMYDGRLDLADDLAKSWKIIKAHLKQQEELLEDQFRGLRDLEDMLRHAEGQLNHVSAELNDLRDEIDKETNLS